MLSTRVVGGALTARQDPETRQYELAPPSPRLAYQAPQPFELQAPDCRRGAPDTTREKVEGPADPHADHRPGGRQMLGEEALLRTGAVGGEDNLGAGRGEPARRGGIRVAGVGADHPQPRST